ncbi:MAG: hypothetical protein WAZ26_07435 [Candidatus Rickettsiella isopodorum]|jgi:hypothetical protein
MEKNKTITQFKVDSSWDNREKTLVFSSSKAFRKRFIRFAYENYKFPVSSLKDVHSLIKTFHLIRYIVIFLDVDCIFLQLNEVLNHIADKRSKNKKTKLYLITSNKEIVPKLIEIKRHKKSFLLFAGKEITYLSESRKCLT